MYPTPASSPSPGASTGAIPRWCEELAEAAGEQDPGDEIYREGTDLPTPRRQPLLGFLLSRTSSEDQAIETARRVERSCEAAGVDLGLSSQHAQFCTTGLVDWTADRVGSRPARPLSAPDGVTMLKIDRDGELRVIKP